jgi:hypothetical protein
MFTPWKGHEFHGTRLLILGESAYSWEDDSGILREPGPDHSILLVEDAKKDIDRSRFMKMVSQGLANDENPSIERLAEVWNKVAFTNYVPELVGKFIVPKDRPRPSSRHWERAKAEFRDILELIEPLRLIVLGRTMWEEMPAADYGDGKGAQAYELSTGELCWCQPLPHPARGLDWRRLAATIYFAVGDSLSNSASCLTS